VPLRVVGDGPLRRKVDHAARPGLVPLGWRSAAEVADEMARSSFLLLPSVWPENFPMVIAEAFCQGLPVIASRIGALAEILQEGTTGLLFSPGDPVDLAAKVRWASGHPEAMRAMGTNARKTYEKEYSPAASFRQLTTIYEAAIEQSRCTGGATHVQK